MAPWQSSLTCRDVSRTQNTWEIMELYLCHQCFISFWALWELKISLCLREESGCGEEGLTAHMNVWRWNEDARISPPPPIPCFFSPFLWMCLCTSVTCHITKGANHKPVKSKIHLLISLCLLLLAVTDKGKKINSLNMDFHHQKQQNSLTQEDERGEEPPAAFMTMSENWGSLSTKSANFTFTGFTVTRRRITREKMFLTNRVM